MAKHDIYILSAHYSIEDGLPIVEIYGKTRENKSIVARFGDYIPYMYFMERYNHISIISLRKSLEKDSRVLFMEDTELKISSERLGALKVYVKSGWDISKLRRQYEDRYKLYSADIDVETKFMYDVDMGSCITAFGEEAVDDRYTCDVVLDAERFVNLEESFVPRLKYMALDIENSIKHRHILCIGYSITEDDGETYREGIVVDDDEKALLDRFEKLIWEEDPDILTGWHSDGYDLPYISKRNEVHFNTDHMDWSRKRLQMRSIMKKWKCPGRVVVDAWWQTKMILKPKREKLNFVANMLFGEGKDPVDASKIDKEWAADKERVLKYCMKDATLSLRILLHLKYVEKASELAFVSKTPLETVTLMGNSALIDSVLIREADRQDYAIPTNNYHTKGAKIKGAYVKAPTPGLYEWVAVLDFKSMYPSVMIENNICFTTPDPNGTNVSPIGAKFVDKSVRKGIIPDLLQTLFDDRNSVKAEMKKIDDATDSRYIYLDGLQNAIKVLMNSFYGVFASHFYRFTNQDIGGSVTAYSRQNIQEVNRILTEEEEEDIVYNDTDSVFIQCKFLTHAECVEFGKRLEAEFTQGGFTLEFEKVYEKFFIGRKKRYFGTIVWPKTKLDIVGYETKRSDSFNLQTQALTKVINYIMDGDVQTAIRYSIDTIEQIKNSEIDVEDLCFSKSVKPFNTYKNPNLPQIQAAKKMIDYGHEFVSDSKVAYIVTKSDMGTQTVEPFLDGLNPAAKPDVAYYADRVAETLARVTEVLGTPKDVLMTGTRQTGVFGFDMRNTAV